MQMVLLQPRIEANPERPFGHDIRIGQLPNHAIVATAQFRSLTKLDITQIPYKGDAATTADLIGGRIQFAFMAPTPALAQARDGRLRMLAVLLP